MIQRRSAVLLLFFVLPACHTRECQELASEIAARKVVLDTAKRRASAFEAARKKALAAEGNASKLLQALGLDLTEDKLAEVLGARVAEIPGATIEQGTIMVVEKGGDPESPAESRTQWSVRFTEKSIESAFDMTLRLLDSPPLLHFVTLARDASKNAWRVDIQRATVPEVPLDHLPKLELPAGRDPWSIPGELGFCAGRLRDELAALNAEIEDLRDHAEGTSIELPKAASYEGLRRRAERVRDGEAEAREHLDAIKKAIVTSHANLRGVSIEGTMTVLEVLGGDKERAQVEKQIDAEGLGDLLQPREVVAGGVERIRIRNAIAERRGPPPVSAPKEDFE